MGLAQVIFLSWAGLRFPFWDWADFEVEPD